jgi:hypothetical protein
MHPQPTLSYYAGYGLTIDSALHLPELQATTGGRSDVTIRFGAVPQSLAAPLAQGATWQAAPNQFLLQIHDVANYLVTNGDTVMIEPAATSHEDDVRTFLFGTVWGALLHQRDFLTLHASAVVTARGAVLFAGDSGVGKSTLAAALGQHGFALLADDKTAITFDVQRQPFALPAYPTRRLWDDSATRLGHPLDGCRRLRANLNKYISHVENFCNEPQPIRAIYTLHSHSQTEIVCEMLNGAARLSALLRMTYGAPLLDGLGLRQAHFHMASAVAKVTPVIAVQRPAAPFLLDELVAVIRGQVASDVEVT